MTHHRQAQRHPNWVAVTFSNGLWTAFGDALIDPVGLSYVQGALVCSAVMAVVLALHHLTKVNAVLLLWVAFVFSRPFGANFGNFLTKDHAKGGLEPGIRGPRSWRWSCSASSWRAPSASSGGQCALSSAA